MSEEFPFVKIIRASAGSGKTYQLTLNYLRHLNQKNVDVSVIRSILAITFTNKAAAEMKHRIIKALKEIAIGTNNNLSKTTGISKEDAARWLDIIILNYDDFRVQTIDSFVFYLLRAMAWEMRIRPDIEPEFNVNRILDKAFGRLLLKTGDDESLKNMFVEALRCFLELEQASSFNPERHFKKRIKNIFDIFSKNEKLKGTHSNASITKDCLDDIKKQVSKLAKEILDDCDKKKITLHKRARSALERLTKDDCGQIYSEYFEKSSVSKLITKSSQKSLNLNNIEELYTLLKESLQECWLTYGMARVAPYSNLLSELTKEMEFICKNDGVILYEQWNRMVLEHLNENVPLVYFSLGEKLKHFLIDEFQDTSRTQWKVLFPLIENALSEGGSFLCVGDPKQSIYMWRQADPGLFDKVTEVSRSAHLKVEQLSMNWRSAKEVVNYNNQLFSSNRLDDKLKEIIKKYLGDMASDDFVEECFENIRDNFKNVVQELPPGARLGGSVEKICIEGSKIEDRNAKIEANLIEKILYFDRIGVPFSDITVLVRTNEQNRLVFSWLWEAGIPAVTEHSLRIENAPTVKAIVNFLRFVRDSKDECSLVGFLQSELVKELKGIESFDESWILEAREKNLSLFGYIRKFRDDFYKAVLKPFFERAGYETAYDITRLIIHRFDVMRRFPEERSFVLRFLELINSMEERLGRFVSLSEFVSLWEQEGVEERLGVPERIGAQLLVSGEDDSTEGNNKGAVSIMTIHGAKGLEFPVVIVPFLDWRSNRQEIVVLEDGKLVRVSKPYPQEVKSAILKEKRRELTESFNLLYVALTRARDHLVIMIPKDTSRFPVSSLLI
ncbi:MAG: UvrD-helicase domain-containing protein [Thermodesulforhabdaceae bacterium]